MTSDESNQKTIYEGVNGETYWIFITDHFTGIKHGDERIPKTSPIAWTKHSLNQHCPTCNNKYTHLDQWGELFNKPDANNLQQSFGRTIHPTGADTFDKNRLVEQPHRKLANSIRAMLSGANLDIEVWTYALYHTIQIYNSFPEINTINSPIEKYTSNR